MFIGTFYHKLEDNARVSLPASFRSQADSWVITRGLDGGIFLFSAEDFMKQVSEFANAPFTKKANRDFVRLLTNEAAEVSPDANGRIRIPERLLTQAQITKDVVITGSLHRIELWDRDLYHSYQDQLEKSAESLAESIEHHDN